VLCSRTTACLVKYFTVSSDRGACSVFTHSLNDCCCRVTSNVMFDRESRDSHQLTVVCFDYGTPSLTSQTHIPVKIVDENDVTPTFDRKLYHVTVAENNHVGDVILQVRRPIAMMTNKTLIDNARSVN